ncbi:MAG: SUMF1/EgtB/PvdO family nonheme iron enzyme [Proteobacteria bacterium]|nr:SUMF1/EgtB/PvdO family nonheme iron enzyme [Pseudomonadota bacterium]
MSSKEPVQKGFHEQLVARFIAEHAIDPGLEPVLLRLMRTSTAGTPTMIRVGETARPSDISSVETLLLPARDEVSSEPAPPTLPALFGTEEADAVEDTVLPRVAFHSLGLLGRGGMAEVHRSRDDVLQRVLAMKVLDGRYTGDRSMRARFLAEAQITAQLAHPSIPPVHAVGEIEQGLPFFTMKEVHGQTLSAILSQVYRGDGDDGAQWTETRLLAVYQKVCEAVAYAHARGVLHGDLKPSNIMVGGFGEVLVMDWGVARLIDASQAEAHSEGPVSLGASAHTAAPGAVAGTPAYMPPEQAMGQAEKMAPAADVYALGVMLFELLTGERPYTGTHVQLLVQSAEGKLPPMSSLARGPVADGLASIVSRAMRPEPEERFTDAGLLAEEIARWLEGSIRRERALEEVRLARKGLADLEPLRRRSAHLSALAEERLASLGAHSTAEAKAPTWKLQDEASKVARQADRTLAEITQQLNGALALDPDLDDAHAVLAKIHFEHHQAAELARDRVEAARQEVLLRAHDIGDYAAYLAGTSSLTLLTQVPATATLFRYVNQDRRLAVERVRPLGMTPLIDVELPVGSYLLLLEAEGRPPVGYPFVLGRTRPWVPRAPGASGVKPLYLPATGELDAGEVFVPEGWVTIGGDAEARGAGRAQRVWVESFAVGTTPVTTSEFFAFLKDPDAEGTRARSDLFKSRVRLFRPDWPATGVSWRAARAYAIWRSANTGKVYRLPTEVEWEKAARGPDARWYPWGDAFDTSFARIRAGEHLPLRPGATEFGGADMSAYGVLGLGGNVRDWCEDPFDAEGPTSLGDRVNRRVEFSGDVGVRTVRGGSWRQPEDMARSCARSGVSGEQGHADVGFRLVRPIGSD